MNTPVLDRARERVLQEMERKKFTQRDVATFAGWSESKVSKALHGKLLMSVDDVGELAQAVGLSITELVRDHGMEFCAEMTPSELRFLEVYRKASQAERDAIALLLTGRSKLVVEEKRAAPVRKLSRRSV